MFSSRVVARHSAIYMYHRISMQIECCVFFLQQLRLFVCVGARDSIPDVMSICML
jgi:hypothetical protein